MTDPLLGFATADLRFDRLLGKGGMGSVYQGTQLRLGRTVAIKVITPHLANDEAYIGRFSREARMLGRLVHPHIIACHDFGPIPGPDGQRLFVMILEYVDGWSLGSLIRERRLSVHRVLTMHAQAAEGLACAHQAGIVHRDVKPDNLMITRQGQAKLADFGLARAPDAVQLTQTGTLLGSPAYMAPELCRGEDPGSAADIYSLGCSLYQVLTGSLPYPGTSSLQLIHRHIGDPIPTLATHRPELSVLDRLLGTCLAKSADQRPSASALASLLMQARDQVSEDLQAGPGSGGLNPAGRAAATVISGIKPAGSIKTVSVPAAVTVLTTATTSEPQRMRLQLIIVGMVICLSAGIAWLAFRPTRQAPLSVQVESITPDNRSEVDDLRKRVQATLDECVLLARRGDLAAARRKLQAVRDLVPEALIHPRSGEVQALIDNAAEVQQSAVEAELARVAGDLAGGLIQDADERLESVRPVIERELPALQPELEHLAAQLAPALAAQSRTLISLVPERSASADPRQLPWSAPLLNQPARLSISDQGLQRLRLPLPAADGTERRGGALLWLGSVKSARMAITLIGPTHTRKIAGFSLPDSGWEAFPVQFSAGDALATHLELSTESQTPFVLAAAMLTTSGLPRADELPGSPGTLIAWQHGRLVQEWVDRLELQKVATNPAWLVPNSVLTAKPVLAKALQGITKKSGLSQASTVAGYNAGDLGPSLQAIAGRSPILFYVPTSVDPDPQLGLIRLKAVELLKKGSVLVIVAGAESAGTDRRRTWQRTLMELRQGRGQADGFGLPIIDLGAVPNFYELNDVPLDRQGAAWQERIANGLEAGLRQFKDHR